METTTNLYLIRHGQAMANIRPLVADMSGGSGLTRYGLAQAEKLRDRLTESGEIQADVMVSSSFHRASQTAQILAPVWNLPVVLNDEMQEMRAGDDNLSYSDFDAKHGPPDLENQPFRKLSVNGENFGGFMLRIAAGLDQITRQYHGQNVVIVTHGGVINGAFSYFFGLSSFLLPQIGLYARNTSITHWQHRGDNFYKGWRLEKYNDYHHLRELETQQELYQEDFTHEAAVPVSEGWNKL